MADIGIKPLGTRVVIEPVVGETVTASGIIIPDSAKEKPQQGLVMAIGNGTKDQPIEVKVGDKVLFAKYAGTEIKHEGKTYMIMDQKDIYAII